MQSSPKILRLLKIKSTLNPLMSGGNKMSYILIKPAAKSCAMV